jgi:hypothetical protein
MFFVNLVNESCVKLLLFIVQRELYTLQWNPVKKKNPTQSIFFSANYILQNLPRNLQISLRDLQFLFLNFKILFIRN